MRLCHSLVTLTPWLQDAKAELPLVLTLGERKLLVTLMPCLSLRGQFLHVMVKPKTPREERLLSHLDAAVCSDRTLAQVQRMDPSQIRFYNRASEQGPAPVVTWVSTKARGS